MYWTDSRRMYLLRMRVKYVSTTRGSKVCYCFAGSSSSRLLRWFFFFKQENDDRLAKFFSLLLGSVAIYLSPRETFNRAWYISYSTVKKQSCFQFLQNKWYGLSVNLSLVWWSWWWRVSPEEIGCCQGMSWTILYSLQLQAKTRSTAQRRRSTAVKANALIGWCLPFSPDFGATTTAAPPDKERKPV